jgi:hypothetical protein
MQNLIVQRIITVSEFCLQVIRVFGSFFAFGQSINFEMKNNETVAVQTCTIPLTRRSADRMQSEKCFLNTGILDLNQVRHSNSSRAIFSWAVELPMIERLAKQENTK